MNKPVLLADIQLDTITGVGKYQDRLAIANPASWLEGFISTSIGVLTALSGIAFLVYFVLGGLTWITAGGEKAKTEKAQKQMTDAAIGLIAVLVAYFIAGIVGTVLDIDILNPANLLRGFPTGSSPVPPTCPPSPDGRPVPC